MATRLDFKTPSIKPMLALLALATAIAYLGPSDEKDADIISKTEAGRGRVASSRREISTSGWKDILWRTYEKVNDNRLLAVAAGVVFYGLLALFPAITALVSSYALFADPATINDHLAALAGILPAGAYSIVEDQIQRVLAKGDVKLGFAFAISLGLAVWSANSGMKAVIDALNVVYDEKEERGFIKLNAVSLTFTLCALLAVLCAIGLVVAVPIVLSAIGLGGLSEIILNYGRWPVLAIMILLGLATLYRFGPSRRSPRWRLISAGGMLATLAWLAGSSALSYYLAHYAGYDATYGSLGAAIGLMMWMWMSTIVILFGAELNAETERETVKDSTDGAPRLLGTGGVDVTKSVETN